MPTTINGIGTHYYGKKNLESEIGQCDYCRHHGELLCYETGLYFVVLYIPLIPLGRKQILHYCPSCSRHQVMGLRQWQELKESAINSSTEQLAAKMDDPEAALGHLETLTVFRHWEDAKQLAPAIEKTHGENVDVVLSLGGWHEQYGEKNDAQRCFDQAYKLDPEHPGSKRARAVSLLQEQRIEEAEQILDGFRPPSEYYDPSLFFMLGDQYQRMNQHDKALEVFDQIALDRPDLARTEELRKAAKVSEKASGLKSKRITQPWFFQQPWFVVTLIIILVLGFLVWSAIG